MHIDEDKDGGIIYNCLRIVEEQRPALVIIANVADVTTMFSEVVDFDIESPSQGELRDGLERHQLEVLRRALSLVLVRLGVLRDRAVSQYMLCCLSAALVRFTSLHNNISNRL